MEKNKTIAKQCKMIEKQSETKVKDAWQKVLATCNQKIKNIGKISEVIQKRRIRRSGRYFLQPAVRINKP
jgi:hypothetical protein